MAAVSYPDGQMPVTNERRSKAGDMEARTEQNAEQTSGKAETRHTGGLPRRGFGKIGVALPTGVALAQVYAKPNMLSVGTKEVYAASPTPVPGGQPSIQVTKDIDDSGGVNLTTNTITGTITIKDVSSDLVGFTVTSFTDAIEIKLSGAPNTWVPVTTLTTENGASAPKVVFTPTLVGSTGGPGALNTYSYVITLPTSPDALPPETITVKNTITINITDEHKSGFHATDTYEISVTQPSAAFA